MLIEYDGIAFDNVNLDNTASQGRCGVWMTDSHGSKVWKYLYGDAQSIHGPVYAKTVVNWAKFMYSAVHNYQARATMEMNFCPDNGGVTSQSLAFNEQLLPYTDLAFSEGAYTDGPNGYTTDGNWQLEAGFSHDIAVQKKGQLLVFNFDYHNLTREQKQWVVANYLLVKGAHSYVYIARSSNSGSNYGYLKSHS